MQGSLFQLHGKQEGRSCSLLQGALTFLGLVVCWTRDRRSQTAPDSVTTGQLGSSRAWSPGQHKEQVELFWKPRAHNWGGTALAATSSIPTCHRTWEALLDGVVQQLSPLTWEPEQNQRRQRVTGILHWHLSLAQRPLCCLLQDPSPFASWACKSRGTKGRWH